jgi:hypothetical protein
MLVLVTGCSTMQPVAEPRDFVKTRQPSIVWLSRSSQQAMVALEGPRLVGDSIVGFVDGEYMEIPMSEVRTMQAKQYSRSRTTTFLLGLTGAVAAGVILLSGGMGHNVDPTEEDDIGIIRFSR